MAVTPNLNLTVTGDGETSKTFINFRRELAGTGADSNMMKIDAAVGAAQDGISEMDGKLNRFYIFAQNQPAVQVSGEIWNETL